MCSAWSHSLYTCKRSRCGVTLTNLVLIKTNVVYILTNVFIICLQGDELADDDIVDENSTDSSQVRKRKTRKADWFF